MHHVRWSPKGRLIEGQGTRPHFPVEWTRSDVVQGRDPDLEAALERLAEQPGESPAASGGWVIAGGVAVAILLTVVVRMSRMRPRADPS